jgi:hypothetical protein
LTRSPRSSPERRLVAAALLLAGLAGVAAAGVAPAGALQETAPPGEAGAKARAALADPRYQRALPDHAEAYHRPSRVRKPQGEKAPDLPFEERPDPPDVSVPVLGAGAFLGKLIFIVLLVVVGVLLVTWIVREVLERRGRSAAPGSGPAAEVSRTSAPEREPSFDDASRLAAEGRYAEAVHALLLAAIRHFAERSRVPVQPSRTSRELVRVLPLGPETREAFAELVRTVELSLFGGAPVGAEEYARNLARFQALTRRAA